MHIHMSYLTPEGFKLLASTYLDINGHHPRMSEIEDLIKAKDVTPAEVAEELMKSDDVDSSLDEVVKFLKSKRDRNNNNDEDININGDAKSIREEEKGIEVDVAKDQVKKGDDDFDTET